MKNIRIHTYLSLTCIVLLLAAAPAARAVSSPVAATDTNRKAVSADQILAEARKHLGKPYRWGGKGPNAFDCAGFVRYVYGRFGYSLAPSATPQYRQGQPLTEAELQPGDLVFYGGRGSSKSIGHVGIVTEVNDDGSFHFIHAARTGVRISHSSEHYYDMRYICACRILNTQMESWNKEFDPTELDQYFDENEKIFAYMRGTDITNMLDVRLVELEPEPDPDTLEVAFVGGIMTRRCSLLGNLTNLPMPSDPERTIPQADVAVGVVNGPISDSGKKLAKRFGAKRKYQMPSSASMNLMFAGFDILSLASQHSNDLGLTGIVETVKTLDSVGIRCTGMDQLCRTAVVEKNGYWYGFCSFGHNGDSPDYMDTKAVRELIRSLRDTVDVLVVTFVPVAESSIGDSSLYESTMQRFAHTAVDCGADIVVGCSETGRMRDELYNGHLVVYGLGPFCMPDIKESPVLKVKMLSDGTFLEAEKIVLPQKEDQQTYSQRLNPISRNSSQAPGR